MSKTPRTTKSEAIRTLAAYGHAACDRVEQLETELAEAQERINEYESQEYFDSSLIKAREQLAEARAEIENLKWHVSNEKAKSEAALALNDKALALVNEARADADHWKSECNALQRMVHEARAEIEMLKHQLEDESMRADGMTTAHAEACAKNYRQQELIEQMREALKLALPEAQSTHCENIIKAALAAERGG